MRPGVPDRDVHSGGELPELDSDGLSSVKDTDPKLEIAADGVQFGGDLHGKFTSGGKDQRAGGMECPAVRREFFKNGNTECGGFSGACLCLPDDVFFSFEKEGNGHCLNRSGVFKTFFFESLNHGLGESKTAEDGSFFHY